MEASTTIQQMLAGNKIFVPSYQRAYSWEIETENNKTNIQVNQFLSDLQDYNISKTKTPYYFGHFLFEEKGGNRFGVIDGQQRLTTIVIFLSALFATLKSIRVLSELENEVFEDIIKRNSTYRFSTVDYDNQIFVDYVIEQRKKDQNGLETESAKRIVKAFDFFTKKLSNQDEIFLTRMLETIQKAICTTHPVKDESEAIQMFIFQNNRGKKPSNLEIVKAEFMFNVLLYGGDDREGLIDEIKYRFEKIYKSISSIEYNLDEDQILTYTLRVYFNSLWESNAIEKINKQLSGNESLKFIKDFTYSLSNSFEYLTVFFGIDERKYSEIHSIVNLGNIGLVIPFVIKAYKFGLSKNNLCELCVSLESLVVRDRVIGTRADITARVSQVYENFTENSQSISSINERIAWLKKISDDYWWGHWNNEALRESLQGQIGASITKFLLWKYENYLQYREKAGYKPRRLETIEDPELEHIAPQTENPASGYGVYDDDFRKNYLNSLGNYLLVSKKHNSSIGNKPFKDKLASYTILNQQRKVQEIASDAKTWSKRLINRRKEELIDFIVQEF